ncbi:hypothetical protein [Cryobacterium aureum]|uniref:hypothetical protein n=1 Tax=Cryobacterium aureum TaxID=995037 RepID=UPI00101ADDAE|nr:hypothetical protein [Cryobacterium aureum]
MRTASQTSATVGHKAIEPVVLVTDHPAASAAMRGVPGNPAQTAVTVCATNIRFLKVCSSPITASG